MSKHPWYILGAGSIGCLWAASLSNKGYPVELILRQERLQSLQHNPVTIKYQYQEQSHEYQVPATCSSHLQQPMHWLILCTKAQHALSAIDSVAHVLTHKTRVLLLQNGMGSQQAIAKKYPELNLWAGSVTDGVHLKQDFSVCHAGQGITSIGPITSNSHNDDFALLMDQFPLNVEVSDNIMEKLWQKWAANCCINGLTALFNCRNGELLDNGPRQQQLDLLANEVGAVLQALGVKVPDVKTTVYDICRLTANNLSSTCLDVRAKRSTELAYMNGFLISQAKTCHIPVINHRRLMSELETLGIY